MILAIITAVVIGFLSLAPLYIVYRAQRTNLKAKESSTLLGLIAVVVSFIILAAALLITKAIAPEHLVSFAIALIAGFFIGLVIFAITMVFKK